MSLDLTGSVESSTATTLSSLPSQIRDRIDTRLKIERLSEDLDRCLRRLTGDVQNTDIQDVVTGTWLFLALADLEPDTALLRSQAALNLIDDVHYGCEISHEDQHVLDYLRIAVHLFAVRHLKLKTATLNGLLKDTVILTSRLRTCGFLVDANQLIKNELLSRLMSLPAKTDQNALSSWIDKMDLVSTNGAHAGPISSLLDLVRK